MSNGARTRADAARIISRLLSGKGSLSSLLPRTAEPDAALLQEICFGVCRFFPLLKALVDGHLEKPLRNKDADVYALLLVGAYQIFCLRIPDHAAVNETVQAAARLKKPWARGLVNGLLRKLAGAQESWQRLRDSGPEEARLLHPQWLLDGLHRDWPDHWEAIVAANNQRPPMTLRVNLSRTTRASYLQLLQEAGIEARAGGLAAGCVYLQTPCPVEQLPGFSQGLLSVQDEASQLVPGLLALSPGQRMLDACAAPGGKTAHCLESEPSLTSLTAVDIEARRAQRIEANLQRLGLRADLIVADAGNTESWWDGQPFQRILLDAPCSATGVIRRHPDIKVLRTPDEVIRLCQVQQNLLDSLWPCLAPGGLLLYTTCSLLSQENGQAIGQFLARTTDAKHQAIEVDWGLECCYGRQLLPRPDGNDGFYYALVRKAG